MPRGLTAEQWLAALEAFAAEHKRMPRGRAPGETPLSRWALGVVLGTVPAPEEVRRRVRALDRSMPRKLGRPPAVPADKRIAELRTFVAQHGRLPRERDRGGEAPLARWAAHATRPGSSLTAAQRAEVNAIREQYRYENLRR